MEVKQSILIFLVCITLSSCASTKKKSTEESETTDIPGPAILAIEIVDGNDNSTELRNNTKRTIESALGYGYQGNYYPTSIAKKFMIYPYSQQDIPPTKSSIASQQLNIQKSVSYNLGTKTELRPVNTKELFTPAATQAPVYNSQQYYPSTLYSTVGQSGIIGGLSTNFPSQHQAPASPSVPVIILRVYSNQLESPAIYPNLPQSHPYANNLNSINLQQILSNYIQQYMQQALQQQSYKQPVYQESYPVEQQSPSLSYQGYQGQGSYSYFQTPQVAYQGSKSQIAYKPEDALPISENYPSDTHTRVVFNGPKSLGYSTASSSPKEYVSQKQLYINQDYSNQQDYSPKQESYTPKQSYIPQEYTPKQSYPSQDYSQKSTYNTNEIYTDANGQNFIYVYPSQLQGQQQQYYQQEYSQPSYSQQQEYSSQEYQPQEDRKYLPTASPELPHKLYNYHAETAKDRSKKNTEGPVTFESKRKETTSKNKN